MFFENIKKKDTTKLISGPMSKKLKDLKKMTLVVKKNHISDPFNQTIKIYKCGFEEVI